MEYKILIPSYHRHERQDTLDLLSSDVFRRDDIIISTQDASDYTVYSERYGERATVIYKKGNSVGDNRNTLLEWCQENRVKRAVMLDDDIRAFRTYDGAKITQPLQIKKMLSQCFSLAEKHGATIFGAYMVDNTFFMKNTVSVNKLLIGTVLGFNDTSLRFDPQFRIKEDFELCLRLISKGRRVLRFNSFSAIARHKTKGGCENDWKLGYLDEVANILVMTYPNLVKLSHRRGEIKMI